MTKKKTSLKKVWQKREYWAMTAIVTLFFMGTAFSLYSTWFLQGASRTVNSTGVIRASGMMLVSREIMGQEDDGLLENVETVIAELSSGDRPLSLALLRDTQYLQDIQEVRAGWEEVKAHIAEVRAERRRRAADPVGGAARALFASSETFYERLNAAAASAEAFSGQLIFRTMLTVIGGGAVSLLVIVFGLIYMNRIKRIAEAATEEITVMKDSLGIGIFLMDRDLVIQPQYSKALERILDETNLASRKFTEFLSSSLSQKELETLTDYFSMVINRSFDAKMLAEINPVEEMHYVNVQTKEEKDLRCSFAFVDQGNDAVFILGTITDATSEKLLQHQLSEEEEKREEEMRTLFEIIQVDPRVFGEFLDDTEYEFDRINELLKNREISAQLALVDIYQSVHAIKSNAIILGLENFSHKIQALESEIKTYLDKTDVDFEDVLHITVEIERVMREKDKFQKTLKRIQTFKINDVPNQDEYVLVQSLVRAIDKAAQDLNKKASLTVDALDPQAIENGPRRLMKEILVQLVRNAVYHGIENPAERAAGGKDESGHINLSIVLENGKIHITLSDDGAGLNFGHIRERARELNLLKEPENTGNNKQLVQAIFSPGFSTADDAGLHAGRGIGLSLVRDRLYAVNGSIKIQTEEGKGTAFHIFLPPELEA
jgi:two-component system chemotaxis sensor kinase CheA